MTKIITRRAFNVSALTTVAAPFVLPAYAQTAEFNLKVPGWLSAAGKRALLPTGLFGASEKHMFEHASRIWARKDPGAWKRKRYGTSTLDAWNSDSYVREFDAWQHAGSPEREPFVSIAAPYERQKQFFTELKGIIAKIGKPMPKPEVFDYDNEGFQPY